MKKHFTLILSFLAIVISITNAQPGWTVYDHTNSTLASDTYTCIAIDQTGNLWAGSYSSGLYQHNGTTWTNYRTSNSNILYDGISDLVVDNSNKVWAANAHGISVYNGTNFTNYDTLNAAFKGYSVYTLGKNNNGDIWVASTNGSFGYQGITTFNGSTWTNLTGYPSQINGAEFSDFAFELNNTAWLACNNGFAKYAGSFTYYPPVSTLPKSESVAVDASGTIWTGGFDALVKYDGSTWTKYANVADLGLTSNTLYYDIFPDGNYLWIGSSSGLLKFDITSGTIEDIFKSTNSPLADNCVTRITKDANGFIWLSTTIGVVKMDPSIVGINELNNMNTSVFPNPSTGAFNFSMSKEHAISYSVYSTDGLMIKKGISDGKTFQIDLGDCVAGVFYVKVTAGDSQNGVFKLIKY